MKDIMTVAESAAREAGAMLLSKRAGTLHVKTKVDGSLVTEVDLESERIISETIKAAFPAHAIAGEEGGASGNESEYLWVIDPLDGTHNYVRGIRVYGVSIGIRRRGAFHAGVVYMPESDELYAAERGGGAYRNSHRIAVSPRRELGSCSIALDSDLRGRAQGKLAVIGAIGAAAFNVRMLGSSARVLTFVAEGTLDAVVEFDDKPWDFAAGAVIVEEAGGLITTFDGGPVPYAATDYVASNGKVHGGLLAVTRLK